MSLLLSEVELAQLGHSENSDNSAVLLDSFEISLDGFLALLIFLPSLGILGEGLLLGVSPVLVESSLEFIREMLSEDS